MRAPGCHLCEDAESALRDIAKDHRLLIFRLDADSEKGAALVARHRPTMFPLVLVDGEYFSAGRLPRRKLMTYLAKGRVSLASVDEVAS